MSAIVSLQSSNSKDKFMQMQANERYKNLTNEEIKKFMDKFGISEKEMSEIFGVTIQCVRLWTSGGRKITLPTSRMVRLFQKYPQLLREF